MREDRQSSSTRIMKNTLMLYVRMFLMLLVSLYTSRVILAALGVEDYGIMNVVGGIVYMFGFLNSAMASSTQRFLTFSLGQGDTTRMQGVFCTSLNIHILIALIVVLLSETIGIWFLYNKMVIPEVRMEAAFWVFQFSILSFAVSIWSVPYNATIIAYEKMNVYAIVSVFEVLANLAVAFAVTFYHRDKLILYAFLLLCVQLSVRCIYGVYCKRNFLITKYKFIWNKKLFYEMLSFSGWNLFGNMASVAFTQGVNLLLNMFFGPIVNAARAVAVQVQSAILKFATSFQTAINPQITKSYAGKDYLYMHSLIMRSSKFSCFLLLVFALPVMMETDSILQIWLKEVPEHASVFLRIILCVSIIDSMSNSLMTAASATGRVRTYQSLVGGILLAILPISYLFLKLGFGPISVFVVHLSMSCLAFVARLLLLRRMINLRLSSFFEKVLLPCIIVTVFSLLPPMMLKMGHCESFMLVCVVSVLSVILCVLCIGLTSNEKQFVREKVKSIILHRKNDSYKQ